MAVPKRIRGAKLSIDGMPVEPLPQCRCTSDTHMIDLGTGRAKPTRIVCVPTPGPDGLRYVPEWFDLTEFG